MSDITTNSRPRDLYNAFTTYDKLLSRSDLPNATKLVACIYAWKKNHKATCASVAEAFEQHRQVTLHPPKRGPRVARAKNEVVIHDEPPSPPPLTLPLASSPSSSSASPPPPAPSPSLISDNQYEAVLQRLGAEPWMSSEDSKARSAADPDFTPPSWELLAAAFYASQDSVESVRRYGFPLTDAQWVERVREHADQYFGEVDNFKVLQLDDRPFLDGTIIAAALRANIPMRPDPLEVLRREQAQARDRRMMGLENNVLGLYKDFRDYRAAETSRVKAVLVGILRTQKKRKVSTPPPSSPRSSTTTSHTQFSPLHDSSH
jgi:hypothetical protein